MHIKIPRTALKAGLVEEIGFSDVNSHKPVAQAL